MFYAPWCTHCKKIFPIYDEVAKSLEFKEPRVILAKIDATLYLEIAKKEEAGGFPTLIFYKD